MGREANGTIDFDGQSGAGNLLLESAGVILRGELRAKIARADFLGFAAEGEYLVIQTPRGPLRARLGAKEAALWVKALAKPLPNLAQKLGLRPGTEVLVIGPLTDAALIDALTNHPTAAQPTLILAELLDQTAFDAALALCRAHPRAAFWGFTRKGKSAFPDAVLRAQMRAADYIDSKSCAVSDAFTATRYSRRSA